MSTNEPLPNGGLPAPTPEPAAGADSALPPAPAASETITADPKDRREVIRQAVNGKVAASANRARDPQGKFTAQAPQPSAAATMPVPAVPPSRPAMPNTWNKELAPHWEAAPLELIQRAVQREEEMKRGLEPFKAAKTQLDELMNEFKPYEPLLQSQGLTPRTAIAPLLRAAQILTTGSPHEKAQAMSAMMRDYGVPLEHLSNMPPPSQSPQPMPMDPILQRIAQQVDVLTQSQQQQAEKNVQAIISTFAASPGHEHFAAVSDVMAQLLQTPALLGEDMEMLPETDRLQRAYDAAIRLNPTLQAQIQAAQLAAKPPEPQASAQPKKPPTQLKGAPSGVTTPKVDPKDRRAVIRAAMSAIH